MSAPESFARQLLAAAQQDHLVWRKLVNDDEVSDAMLGFHAQQAIEKCLKAVLAHAAVVFPRSHDLAGLLDLMHDTLQLAPPHAELLDELQPYAVQARYGWLHTSGAGLDRAQVSDWLAAVEVWALDRLQGQTP